MKSIKGFRAENILGNATYDLTIKETVVLIVGPNGSGKSTFLNLFYLMMSRQWNRLLDYNFSRLTIKYNEREDGKDEEDQEVSISKTDILNFDMAEKMPLRIRRYIDKMSEANVLYTFFAKKKYSNEEKDAICSALDIPQDELPRLRLYITREAEPYYKMDMIELDKKIQDLSLGQILFMPTYRRIEKDLKTIFPDIEERYRSRVSDDIFHLRQEKHFKEIVSFGMDDIDRIIDDFTENLNSISRSKSNAAAQEYIRDMVRGSISNYSIGPIREIDETILSEFIERLDDNLLSASDKSKLKSDLTKLRKRTKGKPAKDMQYLGFFVEKMLNVYVEIKKQETPLVSFTDSVKKYLSGNKDIKYENSLFTITDKQSNKQISLDDLSSGEKQIISVFAYLLLMSQDQKYILFIDEPELSLSVPWQKTFIPDLIATGRCKHIFSVTHSPFVFDNDLRDKIIDVRKLRTTSK